MNVRTVTASGDITATNTDQVIIVNKTTPAATKITLPSSPYAGQVITVKDGNGTTPNFALMIQPAAGYIDGQSYITIQASYGFFELLYDGSSWSIFRGTPSSNTAVAVLRDPTLEPFSSTSIWNRGIGSSATWTTTADNATAHLITLAGTINDSGNTFYQPIYVGRANDPVVTLICSDSTDYPMANQSIHVPVGSAPSTGSDLHMNFYDLTQPGKVFSGFACVANNPGTGGATTATTTTITGAQTGVWDVNGDGLIPFGRTTYTSANGSTTTGYYNYVGGVIRNWEVGAGVIKHMLRCALGVTDLAPVGTYYDQNVPFGSSPCDFYGPPATLCLTTATANTTAANTITVASITLTTGGNITTGMGVTGLRITQSPVPTVTAVNTSTKVVTLSANVTILSGDNINFLGNRQFTTGLPDYIGIIPWGRTMGIPASVDITTLGLTRGGLVLAKCIQQYGIVCRDGSSNGSCTLYGDGTIEAGPYASTFVDMKSDFGTKLVPQLRIMTNQAAAGSITSAVTINGGGTYPPLQPPVDPIR